jgi:hypothetical protein
MGPRGAAGTAALRRLLFYFSWGTEEMRKALAVAPEETPVGRPDLRADTWVPPYRSDPTKD